MRMNYEEYISTGMLINFLLDVLLVYVLPNVHMFPPFDCYLTGKNVRSVSRKPPRAFKKKNNSTGLPVKIL